MARNFFYVCAGLFLLVLSHHFGARSAVAQAGGIVECAAVESPLNGSGLRDEFAVINRYLYDTIGGVRLFASEPIPGVARVVAIGGLGINQIGVHIILEDGSFYRWDGVEGGTGVWALEGTFPNGVTPVKQETWGRLKAKYR